MGEARDRPRRVAVVDIGKTNAKVALIDLAQRRETAVRATPNVVASDGPYPHFDADALWTFVTEGLRAVGREGTVDAICVTTHGAAAALIDAEGALALPPLDYEHDGPEAVADAYNLARPDFSQTGSPRLPNGLNLGAQLYWQARAFPREFGRVAAILPWPQYWAFRLCGVRATEATSLGCHTDLWAARDGRFSSMVAAQGWTALMPPRARADATLGSLTPEVAAATGLPATTPVLAGAHDSNASLVPHLERTPPFAVVSTGTWVIVMAIGGEEVALDPSRDTLLNVDVDGRPTPSARFMGGREFETAADGAAPDAGGVQRALASGAMLTPSLVRGSGPFPWRTGGWDAAAEGLDPGARAATASFYLALMTATCLDLAGARGPVVIEGPFGANAAYLDMLAAAVDRPVLLGGAATATAIGAALLADRGRAASEADTRHEVAPDARARLAAYAAAWRARVEG